MKRTWAFLLSVLLALQSPVGMIKIEAGGAGLTGKVTYSEVSGTSKVTGNPAPLGEGKGGKTGNGAVMEGGADNGAEPVSDGNGKNGTEGKSSETVPGSEGNGTGSGNGQITEGDTMSSGQSRDNETERTGGSGQSGDQEQSDGTGKGGNSEQTGSSSDQNGDSGQGSDPDQSGTSGQPDSQEQNGGSGQSGDPAQSDGSDKSDSQNQSDDPDRSGVSGQTGTSGQEADPAQNGVSGQTGAPGQTPDPNQGGVTEGEGSKTGGQEKDGASGLPNLDLQIKIPKFPEIATPSVPQKEKKISGELTGALKIDMQGVVITEKSVTWQVELLSKKQNTGEEESQFSDGSYGSITLDGTKQEDAISQARSSCLINDIPIGNYTLRLTPQEGDDTSYLPYEQPVEIKIDTVSAIHLINDDPRLHGYEESDAGKFGVLTMGDITGEGTLDKEDKDYLMQMIADGEVRDDAFYDRADLNGDGMIDLLDMSLFVKYFKNKDSAQNKAKPILSVYIQADDVKQEDLGSDDSAVATKIEGSVQELFAGVSDEGLKMSAAKEDAISDDNPVAVSASFTTPKNMEGFVIDPVPGSEGSMVDGEIEVEVVEDGVEKKKTFTVRNGKVTGTKTEPVSKVSTIEKRIPDSQTEVFYSGENVDAFSQIALHVSRIAALKKIAAEQETIPVSVTSTVRGDSPETGTVPESGTAGENEKAAGKTAGAGETAAGEMAGAGELTASENAETGETTAEAGKNEAGKMAGAGETTEASSLRTIASGQKAAEPAGEEDQALTQGVPIVIDLGEQVPVKKITIRVTKTLSNGSLADISKVEFYNDMADRIPEAPMSVPERVVVENGSEQFSLTWKKMPNVTSYEVKVTGKKEGGGVVTQTHEGVETAELEVTSIDGGDLVNGSDYQVEIRSVNGAWKSKPATVTARPEAMGLPPAPENIAIAAGYRRLALSWKNMKDTESYTLYYRETSDPNNAYQSLPIPAASGTQYDLRDLKDETEYEIYLTGTNRIGEGPASLHYISKTISLNPPVTPNYKLINTYTEGQDRTAHIESVQYGGEGEHQFDVADGRYDTSWVRNDWDSGHDYEGENKSPIVTLDQEYQMDTIVVIPDEEQRFTVAKAKIFYWTADGTKTKIDTRDVFLRRKTSNGKTYYEIQSMEPFTAKKVQIAYANGYGAANRISVAEMKFYHYDSLEHDIMDLYEDVYHVVLKEGVRQEDIDKLRARLEETDPDSGEQHPRKAELAIELDNAEKILKDGHLQADILQVDTNDTAKLDKHISFQGGLNLYQPLGVTVRAGDTVTIYVGGPRHRNGDGTRLELFVSQYHGSSNAVFKSMGYLKAGPNSIQIAALDDMNLERGGQLYVEYTGDKGNETYGVRVSGGRKSAVLDLSDTTDTAKRRELIRAYLTDVEKQNQEAQSWHEADHGTYDWDPKNCIYQATDILTRYGMISTAVEQVMSGLGKDSSLDEKVRKLDDSMTAFDEMVYLFYQHKGLSEDPEAEAYNRMPVSRLNIRYQRMFAGAFMYAGGRHIGIEWTELPLMMNGVPVQADENGKYQSGKYFGWGIAHEIGHEINEGAYAVAEITNNYFSVLAQADDTNETVRFKYDDVYKKVTSGVKGKASNVFVQLAMYWQLHLAYDLGGYNYKTYDKNGEQLENLFFGRVDSYVRNPESAPAKEIGLSLDNANTDNKLMRLATAAAGKNILEFFRRWGLEPDETTVRYAEQFEEETRGIWFANDETRAEQMESGSAAEDHAAAAKVPVTGEIEYEPGSNQVKLTGLTTSLGDGIWVYEISRYERVKNEIQRRPVGYALAENGTAEFTDVIGTVNNHAFTYEVTGYDKWLNPTETSEIGSVKVSHDGSLDKQLWTISTNLVNGELEKPNEEHPDTTVQPGTEHMIDNREDTGFTGRTEGTADPEIVINLNKVETITGLTYTAREGTPIGAFEIYVSDSDAGGWTKVQTTENSFTLNGGSQTIHFQDGKKLYTYDASYVRLVAKGQAKKDLTITELSLLGETGDDIQLEKMGILQNGYTGAAVAGAQPASIPAGSLVFTGKYKGNPAFNAVLLYDEDGELIAGTNGKGELEASQIIFAPEPEGSGLLGEVSDGIWVYYIEPSLVETVKPKKVRAELYRVDDAETMEGERLTSSTLFTDVPEAWENIEITGGGQ